MSIGATTASTATNAPERATWNAQITPAAATIVIFGASGDLTARKLLPALYRLAVDGFLAGNSPIIGVARRDKTDDEFRGEMFKAVNQFGRGGPVTPESWESFARRLFYRRVDVTQPQDFPNLARELAQIEKETSAPGDRVFYLATDPELFVPTHEGVAKGGLIPDRRAPHWLRVVVEKPFGDDLQSAQELTRTFARTLRKDQIYRIDHYLGKETVQNILLFRFGNAVFEPLFNRTHVDHVQITVAESLGMERGRGGYYDKAGALRDMLQNHMLQLLAVIAMEPPALFRAKEIRDEKLKVLEALAAASAAGPQWVVRGQYTAGQVNGEAVPGYREEERIPPDSRRETFVALECHIDNWRWAGVPFYLRTGKRLQRRVSEIAIQFKLPPLHLFSTVECEGDLCDLVGARPNSLIFRIQPSESISLKVSTKRPGMRYEIQPVQMDFAFNSAYPHPLPEAYERLLLDVLRGDSTLFTRSDELEAAWRFVTPILEAWESDPNFPEPYPAGTWGPPGADALLARSGRQWRRPEATRGK